MRECKDNYLNTFPRTLLLTSWSPDGHYAGAEAMRRLLRVLPRERVLWCSLKAASNRLSDDLPRHIAVVAPALHWRLRNSVFGYAWDFDVMAQWLARRIETESRSFRPEVIWVLPELLAIPVAYKLAQGLRLPLHATVYDTPESAGDICVPQTYYRRYMQHAVRLYRELTSVDAVSGELLGHVRQLHMPKRELPGIAMPPSLPASWMHKPRTGRPWKEDGRRVIGFCGSFRVLDAQWENWLALLGRLPWQIELLAYASPDTIPKSALPPNVHWRLKPYVSDEREITECFVREGVHACYLGLRQSSQWALFNRTSLSSKLATYLSAAVPVIVDAPEDSVAWRLVKQYHAGMRVESERVAAGDRNLVEMNWDQLHKVFTDEVEWHAMARGAALLCAEEFNLEKNSEKLAVLLAEAARRDR